MKNLHLIKQNELKNLHLIKHDELMKVIEGMNIPLECHGFVTPVTNDMIFTNDRLRRYRSGFAASIFFINRLLPAKRIHTAHSLNSYGLKHDVERWTGDMYICVPNGIFILAAVVCKLKYRRCKPGSHVESPNAVFNLYGIPDMLPPLTEWERALIKAEEDKYENYRLQWEKYEPA